MHMEGNIGKKSAAFFESPGFKPFNFALLERLSSIQHTTQGFAELDLSNSITQKKLKASVKKLDSVVAALQRLLEISSSFQTSSTQTLHPEKLFVLLHENYGWPKVQQTTYQSLLVSIPDTMLAPLLHEIFRIEKVPVSNLSVTFRRRFSNVVIRLANPKADWLNTNIFSILQKGNICLPLQSDSLEVILLRAILCVLQEYDIRLSINTRLPSCLYLYLPSARQLQVFAQAEPEE